MIIKNIMTDIKNTKELVKLVVAISSVLKSANEDGKVDFKDLTLLFKVFPYVGPAIKDIDDISTELKDIDEEEIKELSAEVSKIIGSVTGDEKYSEVTERAITAASEIYKIVNLLK